MKHLLHILFFLIPILAFPQGIPQGISYQAVAYDSEGFEISNQDISVRLGILLGGVDAEASYTEVHSVTTDDFGLFSLVISQGETSDTFSSINWEEGAYLKVEVDANLDGEYSVMGVSSFNAVPYALYAPTDNRVDSLVSLFEYKFELMNRPLQESLDMGVSIVQLYAVGFEMNDFIGLIYQGGLILYVDETGQRGLVASEVDLEGTYEWGCSQINVNGANDTILGSGYQNTIDILSQGCLTENGGLTAASAASNFEFDGFTDWYLPSLLELNLIHNTIGHGSLNYNVGGVLFGDYWSSSESDYDSSAKSVSMDQGYSLSSSSKTSLHNVRPIRTFGNWTMGCMDETACNYNPEANMADDSCEYPEQGYDCEGNITAEIGDIFEGGYLFYLDETGEHGLVAALDDLEGEYDWGCNGIQVDGADGTDIGTGQQNTSDILAGCTETPIAASEVLAYEYNGYSDWYLPSKDELIEIWTTIGNGGPDGNIGGFYNGWYWSSSECNIYGAWLVLFTNGEVGEPTESSNGLVCPIRTF